MRSILRPGVLAALIVAAAAVPAALAQDASESPAMRSALSAKKPKPAKSAAASSSARERRPGELEGWDSGVTAPVHPVKSRRPADAVGERAVPDGGLPLPQGKLSGEDAMQSPLGVNSNGNMSTNFKF